MYVVGYRRQVVMDNLRNAFPEKDEKELRKITWKTYQNFCDTLLGALRIRFTPVKRGIHSFECISLDVLADLYRKDKDIIAYAGHYGSWEYLAYLPLFTSHQLMAAYQPSSNKAMDRIMLGVRERCGVKAAALRDIFKVLYEYREKGIRTCTLLISDQAPSRSATKDWVIFLNQPTPVLIGPEKIAQRLNSAVVYVRVKVPKRFKCIYEYIVITEDAAKEKPMEVTQRFYELLEEDIRATPHLWMWTHKRWKHKDLYKGNAFTK